jgi:hypothetical protein
MKWNKENKKRLWQILRKKAMELDAHIPYRLAETQWKEFLKNYGIIEVFRGDTRYEGLSWKELDDNRELKEEKARNPKYIIIKDPLHAPKDPYGLKIPKDTAEKFLVLGLP